MCGIFGLASFDDTPVDQRMFSYMQRTLAHRGPDQEGVFCENGLAIGINRLSIVDIKTGDQPIFNEDQSLVIVYNGELYNHAVLRQELERKDHVFKTQSDTETVLHAFEEFGPQCLERFNGMFAFAIYDRGRKRLFLARDRIGIKPLYVYSGGKQTAFASESKALLKIIPGGASPDWTTIYRYLSFGYVPVSESAFLNISQVPPGHYLTIEGGQKRLERYWFPVRRKENHEKPDINESSVVFEKVLGQSVELELMSDVPVGIFLSGGLDSSAVAYFAAKHSSESVCSFGLRFQEQTHDESTFARTVADHLGMQHHELLFTEELMRQTLDKVTRVQDEPFADSTTLALLALSEFTSRYVKVVLTGWGGDEILAGYPTYRAHRLAGYYRILPRFLRNWLVAPMVNRLPVSDKYMSFEFKARRFVMGSDLIPQLQHFIWMSYFEDGQKNSLLTPEVLAMVDGGTYDPVVAYLPEIERDDLIDQILQLDATFFLEGNGLYQADRMTMAASLEARVPLLNRFVVDYLQTIPACVKMSGGNTKQLLKRVLRGKLPEEIITRPKKGFGPPVSTWLRGPFAKLLTTVFSRARVEQQGLFIFSELEKLIFDHIQRRADNGRKLWSILMLQFWYSRFIEDTPLEP